MTLGEVARRSNVSMATAQRYKKLYQDRIPSEGEGRKQRYTVGAVKVFNQLKKERVSKRRGGGRKRGARKPAKTAASGTGLLTLSSIGKQTGISYPTLQRYVKLFGDRIPHEGEGRKRRYHPDSVAVFRQLRAESRPGRKPKAKAAPKAKAPARRRKARAKAAPPSAPAPKLLTLTAIRQQTGISGPTLQRYMKLHGDRIPHEGEGRKRRYHPEAVDVFREIRSKSKRGRKPKMKVEAAAPAKRRKARKARPRRKAAPAAAASSVEARLAALEAQVSQVLKKLEQPITITLRADR
ncbi:MAG: hypothetical protein OXG83_17805 [Acidobacteria bacterium]|nr:hypothetical protein [Acidobacteriota bacterium]